MKRRSFLVTAVSSGIVTLSGCMGNLTGSGGRTESDASNTPNGFDDDPYDIRIRNYTSSDKTVELTVRDDREVILSEQVTIGPLPDYSGRLFNNVVDKHSTYEVEARFPSGEGDVYTWEVDDGDRDIWISITDESTLEIHLQSQD